MPANASTTDTHKGIKSIENNRTAPVKIRSMIITTYLTWKRVLMQDRCNFPELFLKAPSLFYQKLGENL